jgi:2-polyprenyl-3-methyl-5-hydroxy-6-metoxy-1,4-benzoquinol methylase
MESSKLNNCPVCGSNKLKSVYTKKWNKSLFCMCLNCHLIFQNPLETESKTKLRYKSDYFQYELKNQYNFFNLIKKTLDQFDIINSLPENAKVLEVGSATGLFLKYMNAHGFNSIGLEICKESVEYGKKHFGVNLINKSLNEVNFSSNSFDFIHFSHLIEHLNDPVFFIKNVTGLLKPGGYILLTTPNSAGLFAKIFCESWRCIVDDHLFIFNKKNLKILFGKINCLRVVSTKTWGSIPKGNKLAFLKPITDYIVKLISSGDVVSFLITKNINE